MIDWTLAYGARSLAFGSADSGIAFDSSPKVEIQAGRVDDAPLPRRDAVGFGEDFLDGQTITIEATAHAADEAAVRAIVDEAATVWRADELRRSPGALAELTAHSGRLTYGRPRRFTPNDDDAPHGAIILTATFETADARWYGPEREALLQYAPAPSGGMVTPLVTPLTTTAASYSASVAEVGGTVAASPIVTVQGPITAPEVTLGPLTFSFPSLSLAWDEELVIDTRPWASTITKNGASVAGALSPRSSWLSEARLEPGTHALGLRGISSSGTAYVAVRWRDAFPTY